ncbi:4-hydroxy-tetrahydrodipicolinate synthase [Bosea sp. BK604]|nr:4-hydroxy-tetrahydrodipicolinate synthase [Bosea sp. BK604]
MTSSALCFPGLRGRQGCCSDWPDLQIHETLRRMSRRSGPNQLPDHSSFLETKEILMASDVFTGTIPALMTPCRADRSPDFDALVRKGKELIAAGMSAVVYCGSMGDWPLLTDEERQEGVARLAAAGVPVIVGTGAQNTQRAAAFARHASEVGAKGLMVIPRVLSRGPSASAQQAHFMAILEAANGLPAVIYNSPYYGFETRAELFFQLRDKFPNLIGFKEFGGAASLTYAAENITGQSDDITLMVGVDTQVFHGFVNCGASGAITGIGNVLPKPVLKLVSLCEQAAKGDVTARQKALELDSALAVLSSFDEGPDLVLFYKYLMVLEGNPEYELHFNASDALSRGQMHYAKTQLELFKTWYAAWSA